MTRSRRTPASSLRIDMELFRRTGASIGGQRQSSPSAKTRLVALAADDAGRRIVSDLKPTSFMSLSTSPLLRIKDEELASPQSLNKANVSAAC